MLGTSAAVRTEPPRRTRLGIPAPATRSRDRRFWLGVAAALVVGTVVRVTYLFHAAPVVVLGDGFDYRLRALRLADGLGYTSALGRGGAETAHHPPGWVTLLAGVAEAGGRSMRAHQVTGLVIGVGVILLAGLVGRRYGGRRVGVVAAFLAAAYPGFWVLDVQILAEPLSLLLVGVLMLVLIDLWQRPTVGRAVLAGAISGAAALVRSEQILLLAIAVAPVLLVNRRIPRHRRVASTGAAALSALVLIAPWTIHNLGRFEEPVVLSTNAGGTLVMGNCPTTYRGALIGSSDRECKTDPDGRWRGLDQSQLDFELRRAAFDNMRDNVDRLPLTVAARYGRVLGVFRPAQTAELAASWLGSATWPIWAWIASFWLVTPLAVYGGVVLRRSGTFFWPLLAPVVITVLVVTVTFGDPRFRAPADLGIVVLAAVGLDHATRHLRNRVAQMR